MKIKITTKNDGVVFTKPVYMNIDHFVDNVMMHEGFFTTNDGRMFNESEIVKAEEYNEGVL